MGVMSEDEMADQMLDIEDTDDELGCEGTATYEAIADFVWSSETHPTDYPANAHWSPFSGTTHNDKYRLWGVDLKASPGVQQVAETGANTILESEIEECGENCTPMFVFECEDFSGTCVASGSVDVTVERPRFSAISMIAPSPDWFVGIHDLELCKFGSWIPFYTTEFVAHDSGTDSGVTYLSPNEVTDPSTKIFFITGEDHVTYHPELEKILAFGNFTITLVE